MLESYANTSGRRTRAKGVALTAFVAAFGSVAIGVLIGNRWILPVLNTLAIYPFFVNLVSAGRSRRAVILILFWALFLSQAVIAAATFFPERAEKTIFRSAEYSEEMFSWVSTGQGKESSPRAFLPDHIRDFLVFAALAFVTAGLGALFMGAVLLNYMNFYVAVLIAASARPICTAALAWQPYAVIRVVGYIIIATALTEAAIGVATRYRAKWPRVLRFTAVGFSLVLLDVIIKASLAPAWAKILKSVSGL